MTKKVSYFKSKVMIVEKKVEIFLRNHRRYKSRRRSMFLYLIAILILISSLSAQTKIYLGTASKGVSYYHIGKSIEQIFNSKDYPEKIKFIETQGSTDNIYRLQKGEIDIALSQNDIAFFAESGMEPFEKPVDDLRAIMSLYPEPIFILSNNPEIFSITQLKNVKVNLGPKASGLIEDSKIILKNAGVWSFIHKFYLSPEKSLEMLEKGELQIVFVNNLSPETISLIKKKKFSFVSIPANLISGLCKTFPYFMNFDTELEGKLIKTIAVKSLLVCKNTLDERIVYNITKTIYENFSKLAIPERIIASKKEVIFSIPLKTWHKGAKKYFQEIKLFLRYDYLKYIWYILLFVLGSISIILVLNFVLATSNKKIVQSITARSRIIGFIKEINLKTIHHKYILVILIVVTVYLTCIFLVQYFEHIWAIKNNVISNFDNQPFFRNLLWLFVFGGSGYSDNLFPLSPMGKFFVTLIPLIGFGGFITIIGLVTSDQIKKRFLESRGVKSKMVKDHIIVCGWNSNVPFLIKNLLHKNLIHKKPIVLLADLKDVLPIEKYAFDTKWVTYIKGDSTNKNDLERANIKDADIAIIITDEDSSDPDARNILKILTIEKYGHELEIEGKRKNRENIYTIAEIQDAHKFQAAKDAYVDEIISLGHIKSKIFVQAVLNPGVSKFINEILTYNDFNDIYTIKVTNGSKLDKKNFDELLRILREHRILLLSISVENHRAKREVKEICKKYGLKRTVITNPISKEEIEYKTQAGDILIVLAQYEKSIDQAIKLVKKDGRLKSEIA